MKFFIFLFFIIILIFSSCQNTKNKSEEIEKEKKTCIDVICENWQICNSGTCETAIGKCASDTDCILEDQSCNDNHVCAVIVIDPCDAIICDNGDECRIVSETAICGSDICLNNEKKCKDNKNIEICLLNETNGFTKWEFQETCNDEETCLEGICEININCNIGEKRCSNDFLGVEICTEYKPGFKKWEKLNDCAIQEQCTDSICKENIIELKQLFEGNSAPNVKTFYSFDNSECNANMEAYDCAYPAREWTSFVKELFVIPGNKVCLKTNINGVAENQYRKMTIKDAKRAGIACIPTDTSNRTHIPRSVVTHNGDFIEGDVLAFNDGEHIYLTGTIANSTDWVHDKILIFESDINADGSFDFQYKESYSPDDYDPNFDYCYTVGQFTVKEGDNYILTMTAYRVPKGNSCYKFDSNGNKTGTYNDYITTIYYTSATKNTEGNFVWNGAPKMFNAYMDGDNPRTVTSNAPVSHTKWSDPGGGQINGIHLDGNLYDIDGEKWFYWIWFENGNHIASAKVDNNFSFINSPDNYLIWDSSSPVVQNTHPIECDESINEGSSFFKRGNKYYMSFAHGHVIGCYSMSYIMADSVENLTRENGTVLPLFNSFPCDCGSDNIVNPGLREIAASGRVIQVGEEYYQFYGLATFDKAGNYQGRKIHYSKLNFNTDGSIIPIKKKAQTTTLPYSTPSKINISWTELGDDYTHHLNILVNKKLHFMHPTKADEFGMGVCQLHAGHLSTLSSWELTHCDFISDADSNKWESIPISDFINFDGFQLSYSNDNWLSQKSVKMGYTKTESQFITLDATIPETIHLAWSDLTSYDYHLNILVNNNDKFIHPTNPELGEGYCQITAATLGYSTYADILGCYFTPISGTTPVWTSITSLNISGFKMSYAFNGNWDMDILRGANSVNYSEDKDVYIPINRP